MRNLPKIKYPMFEITLSEQIPSENYRFRFYRYGVKEHTLTALYRFHAPNLEAAQNQMIGTEYKKIVKISD